MRHRDRYCATSVQELRASPDPKQNIVRVDGCAPTFYVGEFCCLLPEKIEILHGTSIMKLLEVLFCRAHYEVSVL